MFLDVNPHCDKWLDPTYLFVNANGDWPPFNTSQFILQFMYHVSDDQVLKCLLLYLYVDFSSYGYALNNETSSHDKYNIRKQHMSKSSVPVAGPFVYLCLYTTYTLYIPLCNS